MERYKAFIELEKLLKETVSKMEKATTRKEVEALEMETKKVFGRMMTKLPYVQKDIHECAMAQARRIAEADTKNTFRE